MPPAVTQAQGSFNGAQTTIGSGLLKNMGVAVDGVGNVFIADKGNNRVVVVPANGAAQTTVGSGLTQPAGVAVDAAGDVLIADTGNNRVVKVSAGGGAQTTVGSGFSQPGGVAVDAAGNVFIADTGNSRVVKVPAGNGAQSTVGSGLNHPHGVAVDAAGDVYIADTGHNRIVEVPAGNGSQTVVGSGFNQPEGVAVDAEGHVLVADTGGSALKVVAGSGEVTLGSGLSQPAGVAIDGWGDVFIGDTGNSRVAELMTDTINFGAQAVSTGSNTLSLSFTVDAGTTIGSYALVSSGSPSTEFTDAGSTCAAKTYTATTNCLLNVKFKPAAPGLRRGGLVLYTNTGSQAGSWRFYGLGLGPQAVFDSAKMAIAASYPNLANATRIQTDGAGDLFVASWGDSHGDANTGSIIEYPRTSSGFAAPITVVSGVSHLNELFLDGSGNLFFLSRSVSGDPPHTGSLMACRKTATGWSSPQTFLTGLNYPLGLVVDEHEDVFIALNGDNTIIEIPRTSSGFGSAITLASGLNNPNALAFDAQGNLFATLYGNQNLDPNTGGVIALPKNEFGFGAPVTVARELSFPAGLAVDANDNVLVASGSDPSGDPATGAILEVPFTGTGFGKPFALASSVSFTEGVTLDNAGNIFFPDSGLKQLFELPRAAGPTLSFARTAFGATSKDSPQTMTVRNIGNKLLAFTALSYPADFPEVSPPASSDCTAKASLAANGGCTLTVKFEPVTLLAAGNTSKSLTESVKFTTNTLNLPGTQTSATLIGVETQATVKLALVSSNTTPGLGTAITFTATATSSGAPPTGTVTFYDGTASLGATSFNGAGVATLKTGTLKAGQHSIKAVYAGNPEFSACTSNVVSVTVAKATPSLALVSSLNPAAKGKSITFTATLGATVSGFAPAGTVQFYDGSTAIGGATGLNAGKATYPASSLSSGTHNITAKFAGDGNYLTATSNTVKQVVN